MVLWCFNVTVPDLVSLRCYQRLKPQLTKKRGGPCFSAFLPSFGAVFVDLCLPRCVCSEQGSGSGVLLFPLVAKARLTEKAACSAQGQQRPACGFVYLLSQIRTGVVALRRGGRAPASPCMSGILLCPRVLTPEGTGCGPEAAPLPGPGRDGMRKTLGSCCSLVAPGAQTKGRCFFCPSMPPRPLLVGAKLLPVST